MMSVVIITIACLNNQLSLLINSELPFITGWDPDLAYGDANGSSEVPIPDFDEFFAGLPSSFDPSSSVDELGRSKVVAEESRIINGKLLSTKMSSSSNFQKSCDVEMADAAGASSSAPPATGEVPAHIVEFCSFQRELARCDAEGTVKPTRSVSLRPVVPVDALTPEVPRVCDTVPSGGVVAMDVSTPKVEIQPSGSSTTPIRVVDVEPAQESMPPPPAKRVIVLGLPAPSATLAAVPKSRKRPSANPDAAKRKRCTKAGPLPTKASGSGWTEHTVQLGGWPSWIDQTTSLAIRQAEPVQFGG
ncbi:hypothetical protein Bca52824_074960 [Brassica carinata]|uniref:Uncharacterized protein n=1 Tax=Brassica carinata TaxID=52824 RepID=A0A8X7TXH4_BRACI|nr:hypothetical protein Bca52824_074960 [Brassica carinata]